MTAALAIAPPQLCAICKAEFAPRSRVQGRSAIGFGRVVVSDCDADTVPV